MLRRDVAFCFKADWPSTAVLTGRTQDRGAQLCSLCHSIQSWTIKVLVNPQATDVLLLA